MKLFRIVIALLLFGYLFFEDVTHGDTCSTISDRLVCGKNSSDHLNTYKNLCELRDNGAVLEYYGACRSTSSSSSSSGSSCGFKIDYVCGIDKS
jgi:hypothetical protein